MYQNKKIAEELALFDQLPDCANVRLKTVKQLFGISAATVWRQAGKTIPAPRKLSARIAYIFSTEKRPNMSRIA